MLNLLLRQTMSTHALFLFALLLLPLRLLASQQPDVLILPGDSVPYYSFSEHALLWEDAEKTLKPGQIGEEAYHPGVEVPNLDFTTSAWWAQFSVVNSSGTEQQFWLEAARPLTNKLTLYRSPFTEEPRWEKVAEIGDVFPFDERLINHRKMLFPVTLANGADAKFLLRVESDGEVITLPLRLWRPEAFLQRDNVEQSILGTYYGMLIIVFVIYAFFWLGLRDRSFLFYILYVAALFFFQYSIDGLAFQYAWPNNTWLGNHAIVITASLAVIGVLAYAQSFLNLKEKLPRINKLFWVLMAIVGIGVILGISSGSVYALSFPWANITSLFATLAVLITVLYGRAKKMDISPFFALAFVFLVLGGVVFILGNTNVIPHSVFTEQAIKFGSGLEVIFLSITMAQKFRDIQQAKEKATAQMLDVVRENERIVKEQNVMLEQKVTERTAELNRQKETLAEINKDLTDSINYAQRIQGAILPGEEFVANLLPYSFVLYLPKDIISGDFYWMGQHHDHVLFCAADCTGHGVPGALMSMIGNSLFNEVASDHDVTKPGQILDDVREGVIHAMGQAGGQNARKDGMDAGLCSLNKATGALYFAGANNPMYIVRLSDVPLTTPDGSPVEARVQEEESGTLYEIKGHKQPLGSHSEPLQPYPSHEVQLHKGDRVYLLSDGYADQFGGKSDGVRKAGGKKFMYRPLKRLLINSATLPLPDQHKLLHDTHMQWKGDLEQIDDICILGVEYQGGQ